MIKSQNTFLLQIFFSEITKIIIHDQIEQMKQKTAKLSTPGNLYQ